MCSRLGKKCTFRPRKAGPILVVFFVFPSFFSHFCVKMAKISCFCLSKKPKRQAENEASAIYLLSCLKPSFDGPLLGFKKSRSREKDESCDAFFSYRGPCEKTQLPRGFFPRFFSFEIKLASFFEPPLVGEWWGLHFSVPISHVCAADCFYIFQIFSIFIGKTCHSESAGQTTLGKTKKGIPKSDPAFFPKPFPVANVCRWTAASSGGCSQTHPRISPETKVAQN